MIIDKILNLFREETTYISNKGELRTSYITYNQYGCPEYLDEDGNELDTEDCPMFP